jgi:outer membrane protein, heavy metal efflux system
MFVAHRPDAYSAVQRTHSVDIRILGIGLAFAAIAGCAGPFNDRAYPSGAALSQRDHDALWLEELRREGVTPPPQQPADGVTATSTLDDLIAFAVERHPGVQAARAEWLAAHERIERARTLPDPQLSYGVMIEQFDRDRSPVGHSFGVSQMFPWFGKLDRSGDVATAQAEAAAEGLRARRVAVVADVKNAWAEYSYLIAASNITREHRDLLTHLEAAIRSRFEVGQSPHRDLLRVQAELETLDIDLLDVVDQHVPARARLNAALGRDADAPLPAPTLVEFELQPDERVLIAALHVDNPELAAIQHMIAARRFAIQRARLEFYPDAMVGLEYGLNTARRMARMDGGGTDTLTVMASINLPIWRGRYEAGVREAVAEFGASLRTYTDRRNELEADLKMAAYALRDAQRRSRLVGRDLRIRAEQVLGATDAAYRTGEATFTDLVTAQRELIAYELAHQRAIADAHQRVAQIERIVGRQITAESRSEE